jgi:NitT/TauT family transport system substrate-binding protein
MKKHFLASALCLALVNTALADEASPVKLGLTKLGATTSAWIAAQNGIFKKHGLELQTVEIPGTAQSTLLLKGKALDIVLQIPGTAMVANEQGFDMVLIAQNETAGTTPPVSNALMVPTNSPIQAVKDLRGKRIAFSAPRGQGFAAFKDTLQRAGLTIDAVQLVEAPFSSAGDLLRTGQVEAAATLDPYTTQLVKGGSGHPISWYMIETIPDQPVGSWWALRSWVETHQKEAAAFKAALAEAQDYLNADHQRARKAVAAYSGLDPALVEDMPPISWKSAIDPKAWQAVADMMYRQGELSQKRDVAEYLPK